MRRNENEQNLTDYSSDEYSNSDASDQEILDEIISSPSTIFIKALFSTFPPQGYDALIDEKALNRLSLQPQNAVDLFAAFVAWPSQDYYRALHQKKEQASFKGLFANFLGLDISKAENTIPRYLFRWFIYISFHSLRMIFFLPWKVITLLTELLPLYLCIFSSSKSLEYSENNMSLEVLFTIFTVLFFLIEIIGQAITSPFLALRSALSLCSLNPWWLALGIMAALLSLTITLAFYTLLWPIAAQALGLALFPALASILSPLASIGVLFKPLLIAGVEPAWAALGFLGSLALTLVIAPINTYFFKGVLMKLYRQNKQKQEYALDTNNPLPSLFRKPVALNKSPLNSPSAWSGEVKKPQQAPALSSFTGLKKLKNEAYLRLR
jgi:hypothetical protein